MSATLTRLRLKAAVTATRDESAPTPSFQLGGKPCSISMFPNLLLARAPVAFAHGAMRASPSASVVSFRLPKMRSTLL